MINRYPHKAFIVTKTSIQDENGDFIDAETKTELSGRYEPNSQAKSLDYSAKFYCRLTDVEQFELDESMLEYKGKSFTIVQLHNYQTHCEIWVD